MRSPASASCRVHVASRGNGQLTLASRERESAHDEDLWAIRPDEAIRVCSEGDLVVEATLCAWDSAAGPGLKADVEPLRGSLAHGSIRAQGAGDFDEGASLLGKLRKGQSVAGGHASPGSRGPSPES